MAVVGWAGLAVAGWGGGQSHPPCPSSFCSQASNLHRSTQQIPPMRHLPAIHQPCEDREEPTGCFAFSPLCRGVSHQLALDRPRRESERSEEGEAAAGENCGLLT